MTNAQSLDSAKPIGAIPKGFSASQDGMLIVGGRRVDALIAEAGDTPLFVYDLALMSHRIAELRDALPAELHLHYAMKANPHPRVVSHFSKLVDGLDVASVGELRRAMDCGVAAERISFAGPGKRDDELHFAIEAGATINLESEGEAARALVEASKIGVVPRLAVRVNPDFDLKGSGMRMGGGAKPFGVDAERVPTLVKTLIAAGADWRGFHIFAGSQALDSDALIATQSATIALAGRLADEVGAPPPLVNLGGGFGIPYFGPDKPIDLSRIGTALNHALANRPDILAQSTLALELGRYMVAEAGIYLTRVVDKKVSCGQIFAIVDGGLHHQLAASGNFGTVIRRNYPIAIANKFGLPPAEVVDVVGCLCTPLDRLGEAVALPEIAVGDLVVLFLAGAYGRTASPENFLGHPAPLEMVVG